MTKDWADPKNISPFLNRLKKEELITLCLDMWDFLENFDHLEEFKDWNLLGNKKEVAKKLIKYSEI